MHDTCVKSDLKVHVISGHDVVSAQCTLTYCQAGYLLIIASLLLLYLYSYRPTGGSTLYIETVLKRSLDSSSSKTQENGSMELTGNLGNVMKESAQLAYTFAKSYMARNFPDDNFLQLASIHVHVPEVGLARSLS